MKAQDWRICVIGGGPAGLAAAYFLKERGYTRVTVLEKRNRVGGLCCSETFNYQTYDLGANYITSAYKEVLKLARKVGASSYTEGRLNVYDNDSMSFSSMRAALLRNQSFWSLAWQSLRFLWIRWRLYPILSPKRPGFAGVSQHPELTCSFADWLKHHGLSALEPALTIPIALFGYGRLDQVRAAYALTYMTCSTFFDLAWIVSGLPRSWPKRFVLGYQRLWEKIAWGLDVRLGADVQHIERGDVIDVTYREMSTDLDEERPVTRQAEFDKLILACPLTPDVLEPMLGSGMTEEERELSAKVRLNPCVIATFQGTNLERMSAISYVLPMPEAGIPTVASRQFPENDTVMFFTPVSETDPLSDEILVEKMRQMASDMGGSINDTMTYDKWPYFPHITGEDMKAGYYTRFEGMQGENNTFYSNGLLAFELVETVTAYSKALVHRHFPQRRRRGIWVVWLLVALFLVAALLLGTPIIR